MASIKRAEQFFVEDHIKQLTLGEWSYQQCREYMEELLQTKGVSHQTVGGSEVDSTSLFVDQMIECGWSLDVAIKCRNSAASRAMKFKVKNKLAGGYIALQKLKVALSK